MTPSIPCNSPHFPSILGEGYMGNVVFYKFCCFGLPRWDTITKTKRFDAEIRLVQSRIQFEASMQQATSAYSFVFGLIHPANLFRWREYVRALRWSEGYYPPMQLLAIAFILFFLLAGTEHFSGHWLAVLFNYTALATWLFMSVPTTAIIGGVSLRNLYRLGPAGMTRPIFWFEVGRASCVVGAFAMLTVGVLLAWKSEWLDWWATFLIAGLFCLFMGASTLGYMLARRQKWRHCGRAYECIDYFYMFGLAYSIAMGSIFALYDYIMP